MASQHGVSLAEALDDNPPNRKSLSSQISYHCDVSLKCVQVTAIGYLMEALEKRNIKLANSVLLHVVSAVETHLGEHATLLYHDSVSLFISFNKNILTTFQPVTLAFIRFEVIHRETES